MDILKLISTIFTIMMPIKLINLLTNKDSSIRSRVRNGSILLNSTIRYHHQEGIRELPPSLKFMITINTTPKSHGKTEESTRLYIASHLTIPLNKK